MADPTNHRERGAALLVVLLFAAILAITLYQEMPRAVFQARRAKEQLLIDRGHQYARAVQLYYRKFKPRYPPSIEALEDTNNMRFLRHRFKDPFTGKDDWRLIHTNGITLTDSKVNPLKTGTKGTKQGSGSSASGWFSNSTSAFGSSSFGSSSFGDDISSDDQPAAVVPPIRQRPPEILANGSGPENADSLNQGDGDLNAELQADLSKGPDLAAPAAQSNAQQQGSAPGAGTEQSSGQDASNPMQMVRNMLSGESPRTPPQTSSMGGAMHGGGIAGVAARVKGDSIKVVNDQTDYSLWEFVYDPTKDRTGVPAAAGPAGQSGSSSAASPTEQPSQTAEPFQTGSESSSTPGNGTRVMNPQ